MVPAGLGLKAKANKCFGQHGRVVNLSSGGSNPLRDKPYCFLEQETFTLIAQFWLVIMSKQDDNSNDAATIAIFFNCFKSS